jgi:hypothetical protein
MSAAISDLGARRPASAVRVGNWNSSVWSTPGDDDTLVETYHGLQIKAIGPGVGSDLMLAGRIDPEGTVHGILTVDEPLGEISPAAIVVLEGIFCE